MAEELDNLEELESTDIDTDDSGDDIEGEDSSNTNDSMNPEGGDSETDESPDNNDGEESEESTEESDDEEENEEVEEEENLPSQYHRPVFRDIKAKYPNFFKDFPGMREVYFREGKLSSFFPTVEDAEEGFNKAAAFDEVNSEIQQGQIGGMFKALKEHNPKALESITENFIGTLNQLDPSLAGGVVKPLVGNFLKNMYLEGQSTNNQNLMLAAQWAARFGFQTTDVENLGQKPKVTDPEVEKERKQLQTERERIATESFNNARAQVVSRADKLVLTEIAKQVSSVRDEYKRNAIVRDIYNKIDEVLMEDKRHQGLMSSLWKKAKSSNYDSESRKRLVFSVLARVKEVLPAVSREIMAQSGVNKDKHKKNLNNRAPLGGSADRNQNQNGNGNTRQNNSGKKVQRSDFGSDRAFMDALLGPVK